MLYSATIRFKSRLDESFAPATVITTPNSFREAYIADKIKVHPLAVDGIMNSLEQGDVVIVNAKGGWCNPSVGEYTEGTKGNHVSIVDPQH